MGEQVIVLTDLTKQYGNFTAVDHIRLHIQKGEIFGLLGPNGAGKSTTILMMLGLTEPTSGSVEICGINSTTHPIEVKRKIGYLPEDVGFYDDLPILYVSLTPWPFLSLPYQEYHSSVLCISDFPVLSYHHKILHLRANSRFFFLLR